MIGSTKKDIPRLKRAFKRWIKEAEKCDSGTVVQIKINFETYEKCNPGMPTVDEAVLTIGGNNAN